MSLGYAVVHIIKPEGFIFIVKDIDNVWYSIYCAAL